MRESKQEVTKLSPLQKWDNLLSVFSPLNSCFRNLVCSFESNGAEARSIGTFLCQKGSQRTEF